MDNKMTKDEFAASFKIRCSAIGNIAGGTIGLTSSQVETYRKHIERKRLAEKGEAKPLPKSYSDELDRLAFKMKHPDLPETLKSHCKQWVKEKIYGVIKEFTSLSTDKGNIVEQDSLDYLAEEKGYGMLIKNTERRNNSFMEGECDTFTHDTVIDAKSPWDPFTLPIFDDEIKSQGYEWQIQGYMHLWEKKKGKVCYILSDTPERLIERRARMWCKDNGLDELDEETYNRFVKMMTYSHHPVKMRIKEYDFEYDQTMIDFIEERVEVCRKYIKELVEEYDLEDVLPQKQEK